MFFPRGFSFSDPGIKPESPVLQAASLLFEPPGKKGGPQRLNLHQPFLACFQHHPDCLSLDKLAEENENFLMPSGCILKESNHLTLEVLVS